MAQKWIKKARCNKIRSLTKPPISSKEITWQDIVDLILDSKVSNFQKGLLIDFVYKNKKSTT